MISFTNLAAGADTSLDSITTASISPTNGRMVYVAVLAWNLPNLPTVPTISGLSQTWTQQSSFSFYGGYGQVTLFRSLMSTPGSGSLTISFGGAVQSQIGYAIVEGNNEIATTGTNGSDSVVQVVHNWSFSISAEMILPNAFTQPQNAALAFVFTQTLGGSWALNPVTTTPAALTEIMDGSSAEGVSAHYGQNIATDSIALGGTSLWNLIALEVKSTDAGAPPAAGGPFPSYTGETETSLTASSTSHAINLPGSIVAGDLIVVQIWGINSQNIATPTNWTQLYQATFTGGTASRRFAVFVKDALGSEGATQSFTTAAANQLAALAFRVPAADWYGDIATGVAIASATGTGSANPPNLTPSWGALNTLWVAGAGSEVSVGASAPSNYSDFNNESNLVNHHAFRQLAASSENPGTFGGSWATSAYAAVTIAIRPAIVFPTPFISSVSPIVFKDGDTGVVIAGFDFISSQGDGEVYLVESNELANPTVVSQTVTSWSDTSITFTVVKGSLSYGTRYVQVKNQHENYSGFFAITINEPDPEPVDPPPAFGELSVVIYGSPAVAVIVDIEALSITEGINNIGITTFAAPRKAAGINLATVGREIGIWRTGEGEIWKGFITDRKKSISSDGSNIVRFECFGLAYELQRLQSWRGFRFEQVSMQTALNTILDGTDWTSEAIGDYLEITKMFDNMNILSCIDELAKIGNAFWIVDPVSRHIALRQYASPAPMIIANVDHGDTNSKIGMIESFDDYSEDGSAIVNRLVVESKADTDSILTLFSSDRNDPYEIKSMIKAPPSISSVKLGYGATDGSDEIINLVNEAYGENRYYNLLLVQRRSDGEVGKNIRGGSIGGRSLRNVIMGAGISSGGVGHRIYTFDGANPPRGDLGLALNIIDGTISADLVGVGFCFKDVEFVYMYTATGVDGEQRGTDGASKVYGYPMVAGEGFQLSVLIRENDSPATPGTGQETFFDSTTIGARVFIAREEAQTGVMDAEWTISSPGDVWFHHVLQVYPKKIYYIEDEDSIAAYGVHEEVIQLGTFLKLSDTHISHIANAMYDWAVDHITKTKDIQKTWQFKLAWIPRGPLDWNVGCYLPTYYRDEEEDISEDEIICIERTQNFDTSGVRYWEVKVSNKAMFRQDEQGVWLLEQLKYHVAAIQVNQT